MVGKSLIIILLSLVTAFSATANGGDLEDKIRAAQCDIKVFCPVVQAEDIQWTALLHLNQTYGAEIHVGLINPSPLFGCKTISTDDGQFHLSYIGRGVGMDDSALADSMIGRLFDGIYPDIAIFDAPCAEDSAFLASILNRIKQVSESDSLALAPLERIYVRGRDISNASVVLNDYELYHRYSEKVEKAGKLFGREGPLNYKPERFRRYYLITSQDDKQAARHDFISGFDTFRLPDFIAEKLFEGPERRNILNRVGRFRSYMRAAERHRRGKMEQLQLLGAAYRELTWLIETIESGTGNLAETRILTWARRIHKKALLTVNRALGINWFGNLEIRQTPFGKKAKLTLDLELVGSKKVELSHFKFHPSGKPAIVVDSISKIIDPHQRFYRQYPVDLSDIDLSGQEGDSLLFSIGIVVEGLPLDLYIPYTEYVREDLAIRFLPGYTFLYPFTQDQMTALAQPFDWQLMISKPYGSELTGRLNIRTPEGIVVGSYDRSVFMPVGTTRKYINIYLAAGRSVGEGRKTVKATLEVGGQTVAETSADIRIIPCRVPDTRDIAFVPDADGRLEDFLRMARVSFQPFTDHSLIRAPLEAYDLLIIGQDAAVYYNILRSVSNRLREFVKNGGEILILGQSFGWPNDIFEFLIYTSRSVAVQPAEVIRKDHPLLNKPYRIKFDRLRGLLSETEPVCPGIINAGTEIISAGELGSYLKVSKIGDGYLIYCGLPLLEMAAGLNPEAIHLLANLINFGHGNQ